MVIGEKLKTLRMQKNLSQGDMEKRTGLLRCYISRVENGHTVPSVDTLEKFARALEIPMYRFFTDDEPGTQLEMGTRDSGVRQITRSHERQEPRASVSYGVQDGETRLDQEDSIGSR